MNAIETLLNHKTIRAYEPASVTKEDLQQLIDVAKRTATSTGLQHFSMLHITNQVMKEELAVSICGQPYIKDVPEVFIFIVDAYRNYQIMKEQGKDYPSAVDSDRFFQGYIDASLAAQNMVAAAEIMGYGTMYMGSILNNVPKLIDLLQLPKLTFPVVGVGIGKPAQEPQLKPRMPQALNVFENTYQTMGNYMEAMSAYDEEMSQYYDMRDLNNRVDCFTLQVLKRLQYASPLRAKLFTYIKEQGFSLG